MGTQEKSLPATRKTNWLKVAIIVLISEKIIQHIFVTLAFIFNWGDIRATVEANPDVLMILGTIVAVLFGLSLWGMLAQKLWAPVLVAGLALFDILGEFVAQGTFAITVNISFFVAIILFVLASFYYRNLRMSLAV